MNTGNTQPVYEYYRERLDYALALDGKFTVTNKKTRVEKQMPWFKNASDGATWIPETRHIFCRIIRLLEHEGDFNHLL